MKSRSPYNTRATARRRSLLLAAAAMAAATPLLRAQDDNDRLRPPSVPLIAHDPYFSVWSPADKLTDAATTHWTGKHHRIGSRITINGKTLRVMGTVPDSAPALPQTSVEMLPTRTIYTFEGEGVGLKLTFLTPSLPGDIDLLSRPVTYITYELRSTDGGSHKVSFDFDASAELTVNDGSQMVTGSLHEIPARPTALVAARLGSVDQAVLARKGDDIRIDWGHLFLAAPQPWATHSLLAGDAKTAELAKDSAGNTASAALAFNEFEVSSNPVSRWLMVAYDDEYSIQFMRKNLRPFWKRDGMTAEEMLKTALADYPSLQERCAAFDKELMADLTKAGGVKFAKICALAYRQCFAAGKFVADTNGQPISFCKENHSNGCIATSDVFYPMSPQFLLFGPTLAKSFIVPFMEYAASERWKFPFAPHDLGTYPHANGQVYGGGERSGENQMPVEECGNLLILMAAVAHMDGNADFAARYWKQLEQWAEYLREKGFDPDNQLCTDDFAGHMAHNVNLSAKAICGLGSFARLCEMRGDKEKADSYFRIARGFAARWVKEADDGEKFRLAFDRAGTWSQKYNLMWDRILGLELFPADVATREMAYYRKIQNTYGLPLDNRRDYTKLDWILWTATLTQKREDFEALVDPVFKFLNTTGDRSPMTDWYETKDARKVGFTARPVVGGVFARMLYNQDVWRKWAARDTTRASNWATMPAPPKITVLVPAADTEPSTWKYVTREPASGWEKPGFDDIDWHGGSSGFGTKGTPGAVIGTVWDSSDIWLRREFNMPSNPAGNIELWIKHDEDAEVYINGVLALKVTGYTDDYHSLPMTSGGKAALKPGKNTFAVRCTQRTGGQYIDVGVVGVTYGKSSADR